MRPKISVITATLNRRDFLPRCIEGVASQSYPYKEHVIVDGGSTDGTVDLLRDYERKYPHIKWISEPDNGISSALNKAIGLASGEVIGVNGDDDFYQPGALEIVATEFERDPSVAVVSGDCDHIRNDGAFWFTLKAGFTTNRDLVEYWRHWCRSVALPAPSTFFKKEVVAVVGGFEEADRYAMDYHHWIKITRKFKVKIVSQTLANFRCDEGTVSWSQGKEQLDEMYAISRKYWGSIAGINFYRMAFSYLEYHKWPPFKSRVQNALRYRLRWLLRN